MSLIVGGLIVALFLFTAVAAPVVTSFAPDQVRAGPRLAPPSQTHPFGTDTLGRDMFSRVLFGAAIAVRAAVVGMGIAALLGIPPGLLAGYRGGWLDRLLSRLIDVWLAFPGLLLAFNAVAQDHSQHQMPMPTTQDHSQHQMPAMQDHTQHQAKPKAKPKPATKPKPKATAPVDHAAMGHEMPAQEPAAVDHSAMGHDTAQPTPMDHAAMGHVMPRHADQPVTPIPALTDEDRAAAAPPPNDRRPCPARSRRSASASSSR